jgi:hypothetical protein
VVGDVIQVTGGHPTLDKLFRTAGAPGEPPDLAHHSKWKEWLFRAGQDPNTDSLAVLGNVLEEYMDTAPKAGTPEFDIWQENRARIETALADNGLRYYRLGRVLPQGQDVAGGESSNVPVGTNSLMPSGVDDLLKVVAQGLRRAMHPLTHRRKGAQSLSFSSEYDVQDLLHAMLRPWVSDIRSEEYTPSYAGTSTRMDFLLPDHGAVIETKLVRDRAHGRTIGNELIIDIAHYQRHPACRTLWCVIYDPDHLIANAGGLRGDLEGLHSTKDGEVQVRVLVA